MRRFEWPEGGVEFHLAHGEWVDVLRQNGFELERLLELQAPADAETHEYYAYVTAEWARKWPAEEIWVRANAPDEAASPRVDLSAASGDPDPAADPL